MRSRLRGPLCLFVVGPLAEPLAWIKLRVHVSFQGYFPFRTHEYINGEIRISFWLCFGMSEGDVVEGYI